MVGLGGWIGAIVLGGLAGWVASMIMRTDESMGLFLNIVVGIVGAIIGNIVFGLLGGSGTNGFSLWSFIVALIGAIILLFIVRLFTGSRTA
jgi:uncharacterized membrane protein YeaQ/YmgE (transglycosylase-associated protein family)